LLNGVSAMFCTSGAIEESALPWTHTNVCRSAGTLFNDAVFVPSIANWSLFPLCFGVDGCCMLFSWALLCGSSRRVQQFVRCGQPVLVLFYFRVTPVYAVRRRAQSPWGVLSYVLR